MRRVRILGAGRWALAVFAAMMAAAGPSAAGSDATGPPAGVTDLFVFGTRFDWLEGADDGGEAEAHWVRSRTGWHSSLGVTAYELGSVRWLTAAIAGSVEVAPRWRLEGDLRLGPGESGEDSFTYVRATVGATYEVSPKRLSLVLRNQYFDIDRSRGDLLQVGLRGAATRGTHFELLYHDAIDGDEDIRLVSARIDVARDGVDAVAGLAAGRTSRALIGVPGLTRLENDYQELFAGLSWDQRRRPFGIVLSHQAGDFLRRFSLSIVVRQPRLGTRSE